MIKKILVTILVLCGMGMAQDTTITSVAKTNIAAKHRKAMIEKAEHLLQEKAQLEKELATVNNSLEKIDSGEDQKEEAPLSQVITLYSGAPMCSYVCTVTPAH